MTTVYEVIYQAFRESDLIDETEHPTPTQANEGLSRLNGILDSVLGYEVGEQLLDWSLGDYGETYTESTREIPPIETRPPINSRLIVQGSGAQTVYLYPQPRDGSRMGILDPHSLLSARNVTLDGNGRLIEGAATLVLSTNGLSREWMYRADQGNWVRVTTITDMSADMPYPAMFDDFFITSLAMRLNPRHSIASDPSTIQRMERMKGKLRARYRQTQEAGLEYPLIHRRFNRSISSDFNTG